jgi:superfamily II helicase
MKKTMFCDRCKLERYKEDFTWNMRYLPEDKRICRQCVMVESVVNEVAKTFVEEAITQENVEKFLQEEIDKLLAEEESENIKD